MATIHIEGVDPRLDGEHELDLSRFSNWELHIVKQNTGLRGIEFEAAIDAYDTDAIIALAWIALSRKNIAPPSWDILWHTDVGQVRADFRKDNEEAQKEATKDLPPTQAPKSEQQLSPEGASEQSAAEQSSGGFSSNGSENRESTLLPTGDQTSVTGAESDPQT